MNLERITPWTKVEEDQLIEIVVRLRNNREPLAFDRAGEILNRSTESCRSKWYRLMKDDSSLSVGLCPLCGYHKITPRTKAARAGMCEWCYQIQRREDYIEKARLAKLEREADNAKNAEHKARGGSLPTTRRKRVTCPHCGKDFLAGGKDG